jgi:DNA replication and repair protein RecF
VLVQGIETVSFRNLNDQVVRPGPRFNILAGPNAQGKTNFLEAVYLVACLRSFRAHRTREMIRFGADEATVRARVEAEPGLQRRLEVQLHQRGRRARVDGKGVRSTSTYLGGLNVVLFSPDDLQIPRGSPGARRQLLDRAIANLWPAYLAICRDYTKALQSRNRVLRQRPRQYLDLLQVYDQQLAELGAKLVAGRLRYIDAITARFGTVFGEIARSGVEGTLAYLAPEALLEVGSKPTDLARHLRERLRATLKEDLGRQATSVGPQTHDLDFRLDGRTTRSYGSQGQVRTLLLSFKIAQILDTYERLQRYPVLLLDDVSSELDPARNKYLFDFLEEIPCQAFLTTTQARLVALEEKRLDFHVVNGQINGPI